ncbi:MAG: tripartite tricarboxylate transporter substrate binding protein, partial [Burkholderiales bacterium]|nr:tripartite tricarboxylate transporter substrate binding protein [Burkholderiales bacterium]
MTAKLAAAVLALAVGGITMASSVGAQESASSFPSRPIKLVVSSAPGGFNDVVGRIVAGGFAASPAMNGQQGIVDNRPGGGGILAAQYTANAPADGYTLLMADTAITSIIPVLTDKPPFDSLRDFVPVSLVVTAPFFLAVNASLGVSSVEELVALAKSKP